MESQRIRSLSSRYRSLVAMAVLLDGQDASKYLAFDLVHGDGISRAAEDLASMSSEVRLPLVATILRNALTDMQDGRAR